MFSACFFSPGGQAVPFPVEKGEFSAFSFSVGNAAWLLVELRLLPLLQLSLGTIPSMGAGPGILSRHPLVPGESSGESAAAVRAAEARHRGISQPFFPWRNGPEAKSCEAVEAVRSLKSQADFSSPAPFP